MILSDLIVSYLAEFGVEYVFSVPGTPLSPLYDALARREKKGGPRLLLARHENGAAFMADGYARETGKIGVCCVTTGPGATNVITGIAGAYADRIPLLVITAQTLLPHFSLGAFQESSADVTDIVSMFEHCTRYNSLITHPKQLEHKLTSALTSALQLPKGPAHLSIPVDIFRSPAPEQLACPNLHRLLNQPLSEIDRLALETLCQALYRVLSQNQKVVLVIGHECKEASQEIIAFAELIGASIVTTQRGKSAINPYHPLARGVFGFAGHKTARNALADESVGLILAVGTTLWEWSTSQWDSVLLNEKLVHIQNVKADFIHSPMAHLHVYGTIKTIFQELVSQIETMLRESQLSLSLKKINAEALEKCTDHKTLPYVPPQIEVQSPNSCLPNKASGLIKSQHVICELTHRFPANTRFLVDNSNSVPWTIHYFFHPHPENYHLSIGLASMGWAIGAAVGMSLGRPNTPIVCFTGDGCFLMSGQEITVAVAEKLPVIFVVQNDQAYGMIKHGHRLVGSEQVDFSISPVDFNMMAKSVGAQAYTIRDPKDFDQIDYQALCTHQGPTVLEIYIDPEESPPLGMF
jgi:acetolactate synthase I/II/III large subunit